MTKSKIFIGNSPIENSPKEVKGDYVVIDGEEYYKISNYDTMRPFFMTLVSNSDLWLFISSNGGLSAGRNSPETALFPYYSDDKITDRLMDFSIPQTGSYYFAPSSNELLKILSSN